MVSEHSPIPWTISEDGRFLIAANGNIVCDVHGLNTTREEDRANAKFIRDCVNSSEART